MEEIGSNALLIMCGWGLGGWGVHGRVMYCFLFWGHLLSLYNFTQREASTMQLTL
jgi:hypothetical protein